MICRRRRSPAQEREERRGGSASAGRESSPRRPHRRRLLSSGPRHFAGFRARGTPWRRTRRRVPEPRSPAHGERRARSAASCAGSKANSSPGECGALGGPGRRRGAGQAAGDPAHVSAQRGGRGGGCADLGSEHCTRASGMLRPTWLPGARGAPPLAPAQKSWQCISEIWETSSLLALLGPWWPRGGRGRSPPDAFEGGCPPSRLAGGRAALPGTAPAFFLPAILSDPAR
jgi:hypothetical protein